MLVRFGYAAVLQLLIMPGVAVGQTTPQPPKPPVLTFAGRIPLPPDIDGRIDHTSIDLAGQRLFTSGFGNNILVVTSLKTNTPVRQITSLSHPQNSYYVPSINRLFVSNQGDGTVRIFDGTSFALQKTVQLSSDADNIRYDARRKHVLVDYGGEKFLRGKVEARAGVKDGAVAVLDLDGNKVADIPTGGHPESLQLEQNGNRIFINSPDNHYVTVADLDSYKVLAHWDIPGCENYPMALDEDHHRIFVFCRNTPGYVLVIDTESGKQVTKIPATPESSSDDMFYDPGKGRLYVMSSLQQVPGEPGVVDVIQQGYADHYEKIATYPTGPVGRDGLFVPELGKLFVSTPRQPTGQGGEYLVYDTR
ncbi:MAG TPA: YncE family protein [Micropepsaceae bacterium]|nr:YncE family protein [Micropepsaceae bacterium]